MTGIAGKEKSMRAIDKRFAASSSNPDKESRSDALKAVASELLDCIDLKCPPSREKSLAVTKLEECVMWAVKAIELWGAE